MRYLIAAAAAFAAGLAVALGWRRTTVHIFTRVPPETPPDSAPRYRHWQNGQEHGTAWPSPE